jgi:hypothetical protein
MLVYLKLALSPTLLHKGIQQVSYCYNAPEFVMIGQIVACIFNLPPACIQIIQRILSVYNRLPNFEFRKNIKEFTYFKK